MPTPPTLPTDAPLPVYSEPPINGVPGAFSTAWYKWFTIINTLTKQLKANASSIVSQPVAQIDSFSGFIQFPIAQDYVLMEKIPHDWTILLTTTDATAGTATATFKINGTPLGGSPNAVSNAQQDQAHATSNVMAAGDKFVLSLSGVTGLLNFSFTIKATRNISQLAYA